MISDLETSPKPSPSESVPKPPSFRQELGQVANAVKLMQSGKDYSFKTTDERRAIID
jgi:hypothetical protein